MKRKLIDNGTIVNEGESFAGYIEITGDRITAVGRGRYTGDTAATEVIDAAGKYVIPGVIDDQVHFREPGLTRKADIHSESVAAAAGGVTSFMDMPNTKPPAVTGDLLQWKFDRAAETSVVNYSFYLGATNENIRAIEAVDPRKVCGVKVFMGSSTGDMLVDDERTLAAIFSNSPVIIAAHCEDEATIRANTERYRREFGDNLDVCMHPLIRSAEACYRSSARAVELAVRYGARLHVLHLSTGRELSLFSAGPLGGGRGEGRGGGHGDGNSGSGSSSEGGKNIKGTGWAGKKITCEVCVHHLWFTDEDYPALGNLIKWNPAIKTRADRDALREGVRTGKVDVVATDHAPHTLEEKRQPYISAPSGGPLVQHSLTAMTDMAGRGHFTMEQVVERMCHAPARLFEVKERGFLREGYFADIAVVDPAAPWTVDKSNILYKCGWSPFEGHTFGSSVTHTIINGAVVYRDGHVDASHRGRALEFDR